MEPWIYQPRDGGVPVRVRGEKDSVKGEAMEK